MAREFGGHVPAEDPWSSAWNFSAESNRYISRGNRVDCSRCGLTLRGREKEISVSVTEVKRMIAGGHPYFQLGTLGRNSSRDAAEKRIASCKSCPLPC